MIGSAIFSCINKLHPADRLSSTRPGRQKTSRPYPLASLAVMVPPPLAFDSISTVAPLIPAMMRLRRRKFTGTGCEPGG